MWDLLSVVLAKVLRARIELRRQSAADAVSAHLQSAVGLLAPLLSHHSAIPKVAQLYRLLLAAGASPSVFLGWHWAVPLDYHGTHMLQVRWCLQPSRPGLDSIRRWTRQKRVCLARTSRGDELHAHGCSTRKRIEMFCLFAVLLGQCGPSRTLTHPDRSARGVSTASVVCCVRFTRESVESC